MRIPFFCRRRSSGTPFPRQVMDGLRFLRCEIFQCSPPHLNLVGTQGVLGKKFFPFLPFSVPPRTSLFRSFPVFRFPAARCVRVFPTVFPSSFSFAGRKPPSTRTHFFQKGRASADGPPFREIPPSSGWRWSSVCSFLRAGPSFSPFLRVGGAQKIFYAPTTRRAWVFFARSPFVFPLIGADCSAVRSIPNMPPLPLSELNRSSSPTVAGRPFPGLANDLSW